MGGLEWSPFGLDWSWAHNGIKANGWIKLRSKGQLMTKWGPGNWQLLRPAAEEAPLLLVTFGGIEHALRLILEKDDLEHEARFDVVALRRIKDGERSLTEDPEGLSRASVASAPAACATQGWPGIDG